MIGSWFHRRLLAGGLAAAAAASTMVAIGTPSGASAAYNPFDAGSLYSTTVMTGARQMWNAGFTGKGVDVALIDTGIAPVQGLSGPGKVVYGADVSWESQAPNLRYNDTFGHGTHMAGIIAGRDAVESPAAYAADTTQFLGMAPDARIISVKAADAHGGTDVTQIIAAIDWVVQHRYDNGMNIRLVNLSFGTDSTLLSLNDPLSYAVEQAWLRGIAVIVASGNDGLTSLGLANPARDPYVIAVGAADTHGSLSYSDDRVASFSDYGNLVRNPDLLAPGVHIASLRDPGSYIDQTYGTTGRVGSRFFRGSGTSQAAAVVTGAAALLLQQRPALTPDQLKNLLTQTADPLPLLTLSLSLSQGHGEIDLGRAMRATSPGYGQFLLLLRVFRDRLDRAGPRQPARRSRRRRPHRRAGHLQPARCNSFARRTGSLRFGVAGRHLEWKYLDREHLDREHLDW
jgi:serine protease AprX